MAKRVSIINFKGGVGKTTLAFHLATGLVLDESSPRVLLIDVDHQSSLSILCLGASRWSRVVEDTGSVDRVFQHITVPGQPLPATELVVESPLPGYDSLDIVPASLHLDDTEIELAASQVGSAITSEWIKRTLLCQWLEASKVDREYDYIIFDCPPATKIVSQNAIAASHGYIVPVVPEAVMERGAPHLVELLKTGIDAKLKALAKFGERRKHYVSKTKLVGLVVTQIKTSGNAYSGYTNDHTEHLKLLQRVWGKDLIKPYIPEGTGVPESLTAGVPVYDREYSTYRQLTQNIGRRGIAKAYRELVAHLKEIIDGL